MYIRDIQAQGGYTLDSYFLLVLAGPISHIFPCIIFGVLFGVLISQLRAKEHPGRSVKSRDESKVRKPHVCLNTRKKKSLPRNETLSQKHVAEIRNGI